MDAYPIPDPVVVGRVMESDRPGETEAVLVIPSRGKVKVLNEVGTRIWKMVDGQRSVREIAAKIWEEYDVEQVEAEDDTLEFIKELVNKKVISLSDTPVK